MSSATESFRVSGPSHLTAVDWTNSHHRKTIAASLVEGVYKIERDRQKNRQEPQAKAPPYWEFFHFKLNAVLNDDVNDSIFCAIYEYRFPHSYLFNNNHSQLKPPKFVVAFRGNLPSLDTISRDLKLDYQYICKTIHESPRVLRAMQAVQGLVSSCGVKKVWLAGHSLGSAIGLLVGKSMAEKGFPLETYLFNPPSIPPPIHAIRIAGRAAESVFRAAVKGHHHHHHQQHNTSTQDNHDILSAWFPYFFLNPNDRICSDYIRYFEHRNTKIGKLATKKLVRSFLSSALGKDFEPYDLLPSAYVIINLTQSPDFRSAHGVEQWWNPNFQFRSTKYEFSR